MSYTDARTDIIIFAAYWNEANWIEPSLAQIRAIDPVEVIISEGCFDPAEPRESTDGTRDRLESFVDTYDRATLINAKRLSPLAAVRSILQGPRASWAERLQSAGGWKALYKALRSVAYRRNQAATFNEMIRLSDCWEPGRWFMTYDADQFYSDAMVEAFTVTATGTNADLLTGEELTFFGSFDRYTREYEHRTYNNMPHRIFPETMLRPTRDVVLDRFAPRDLCTGGLLQNDLYINQVSSQSIGEYYHYKLRAPDRYTATYAVGDREEPAPDAYNYETFDGSHPTVVEQELATDVFEGVTTDDQS